MGEEQENAFLKVEQYVIDNDDETMKLSVT